MHRIEVAFRDESLDSVGLSAKSDVEEDLGFKAIEKIRFSELYYLDLPIGGQQLSQIAEKVFSDPILQSVSVDKDLFSEYDFLVEVKLHEDVTDNLGIVALEGIEDFLGKKTGGKVRSARRYYLKGELSSEDAQAITKGLFANEIIETFRIGAKNG